MMDSPEVYSNPNPADVFEEAVRQRQEQLEFLSNSLRNGLEIIRDLDKVNEIISASARPDLTMSDPVEMMPVNSPYDLGRVNNFIPNLQGFGRPIYEDREDWRTKEMLPYFVGRRPLNREELDLYFFMGARGGYHEHRAFAEANGIDKKVADDIQMQTHASKESFMRMWILFPEVTEFIVTNIIDSPENLRKPWQEEVFVAYSLMARLVDRSDVGGNGAIQEDGTVDTWLLCH